MDCDDAASRLPWMLNGTLDAGEAEQLRQHLAGCGRCREELEETRQAAAVFSAHLPTSVLMDMAWDRPGSSLDAGLADRHLEHCPECSEELDLARQSRRLQGAPEAAPRPRRVPWSQWAALPASLAAGLAVGVWWGTTRVPVRPVLDDRVPSLESEVARLREAEKGLRAELDSARRPQLNLPVFELFPANQTRRSAGTDTNDVTVSRDARQIAFVLGGGTTPGAPATVEILDARQRIVWSGEGLRPGSLGAHALAVPRTLLPDGEYVLVVRAPGGSATAYPIRVRAER